MLRGFVAFLHVHNFKTFVDELYWERIYAVSFTLLNSGSVWTNIQALFIQNFSRISFQLFALYNHLSYSLDFFSYLLTFFFFCKIQELRNPTIWWSDVLHVVSWHSAIFGCRGSAVGVPLWPWPYILIWQEGSFDGSLPGLHRGTVLVVLFAVNYMLIFFKRLFSSKPLKQNQPNMAV